MLDVEQFADEIAQHHAEFFAANPKGEVPHHCVIFTTDDSMIVECGWATAEERAAMLGALAALMEKMNAVRYVVTSEAWMLVRRLDQPGPFPADNYRQGDLAKHPERVEVVTTLVVDISGAIASRFQEIVRDENGAVVELKAVPSQGTVGEGALASLLPTGTMH